MNRLRLLLLGALLASVPLAHAGEKAEAYIDTQAVDVRTVLSDPPADGSAQTKAEIDALLARQAARTPADVARAKAEEKFTPFAFTDVLGPWFTPENLPETKVLLEETTKETAKVYKQAKEIWNRPRPPYQDARIHPSIEFSNEDSYPSGHATRGMVIGLVLGELAPDLKGTLEKRGEQIGEDRLIAGVHFPSDVAAGQKLGRVLFAEFEKSPAFQAQLAKAKAEFARVRPAVAAKP